MEEWWGGGSEGCTMVSLLAILGPKRDTDGWGQGSDLFCFRLCLSTVHCGSPCTCPFSRLNYKGLGHFQLGEGAGS